MRKVILGLAVTLDGFIEGPNGEYDWCFTDQDYGLNAFFQQVDALFMGRRSYEEAKKYEGQNPWQDMTTYVFSRTMKPADDPKVILVPEGSVEAVQKIKQEQGMDIWLFGGADLTRQFINTGLVDELWLSVHPILLGSGKPLFQGILGRKPLKLLETKAYETGLVSLKYALA
jgi:dihydrofolate reductase